MSEEMTDGNDDLARAAEELEVRIPAALAPLARLAFNYWWSWAPGGPELFRAIDAQRFELSRQNPVRLLKEAPADALMRVARDKDFVERAESIGRALDE